MASPKKELLLIFTRNPELGKCKTRLAATIGDQAALDIYRFLLEHTLKITRDLEVDKRVYYSESLLGEDIWPSREYGKYLQEGADLGARMQQAFEQGFADGYDQIIIIGSDIHQLEEADLRIAFEALDTSEFVVGPAADGGYYLLGCRKLLPELFLNKTWGGPQVLEDTLRDLNTYKTKLLDVRNDVDIYEDIKDEVVFKPFLKHLTP